MQVVALQQGFYGASLRQVGDRFEVPDGTTAKWFAPVDAAPAPKPKAKKDEPKALSELNAKGKSFNDVHGESLA